MLSDFLKISADFRQKKLKKGGQGFEGKEKYSCFASRPSNNGNFFG